MATRSLSSVKDWANTEAKHSLKSATGACWECGHAGPHKVRDAFGVGPVATCAGCDHDFRVSSAGAIGKRLD